MEAVLGVIVLMMVLFASLEMKTIVRFAGWVVIGIAVYYLYSGRRRSSVHGKSGFCRSVATRNGPGVCPIGSKRASRRASASKALTGKVS